MKIPLVTEDWFLEKIDDAPTQAIAERNLWIFLLGSLILLPIDFVIFYFGASLSNPILYIVFSVIFIWGLAVPVRLFTKWIIYSL